MYMPVGGQKILLLLPWSEEYFFKKKSPNCRERIGLTVRGSRTHCLVGVEFLTTDWLPGANRWPVLLLYSYNSSGCMLYYIRISC